MATGPFGDSPVAKRRGVNDGCCSGLPQIRAQRYALDQRELVAGISARVVPILPPKRDAVASIANMTSARRALERRDVLLELLRVQVARIEEMITPGGQR